MSTEVATTNGHAPAWDREMKRCPDCDRDLPATLTYFHRRAGDKLNTYCKPCANARARAHHDTNRTHHLELMARYREAHREEWLPYFRAYRQVHSEKRRVQDANYRRANLSRIQARKRAYYLEHRADTLAANARWQAEHPEAVREHTRAKNLRRRSATPDQQARHYIRILAADPCAYCGRRAGRMEIDHIVPLRSGGTSEWMNLTSACRSCNGAKCGKSLLVFLTERAVG